MSHHHNGSGADTGSHGGTRLLSSRLAPVLLGRASEEDFASREFWKSLHFRLFQVLVAGWSIYYAWYWGLYALRNREVVLPLGAAHYLPVDVFFAWPWPLILAVLICVSALFALIHYRTRFAWLVLILLLHLLYVIRFSQGEIPHSSNLIGMSALALGIGQLVSPASRRQERLTLRITLFFIGLGYVTASVSKMIGTGPMWAHGDHLTLWIAEKSVDILSREGQWAANPLQQLALSSTGAATMILLFGWIAEASGFLFWFTRTRPFIAVVLIAMHLGITMSMNIRFDSFVSVLLLLGFPWAAWACRAHLIFSSGAGSGGRSGVPPAL